MRAVTLAAVLALWAVPAAAQEISATDLLLRAFDLPVLAQDARGAGVPDSLVRVVLERVRRELPAGEAEMVLREEVEAVKAGGPKDNFGAFVQTQLAAGLRGRDLAAAIRAEHARRGIGRPDQAGTARGQRGGPPEGRGKPDTTRGRRND